MSPRDEVSDQVGSAAPLATSDPRHIVVVGPCAAGKSTLVAALRELGYQASVSGQEHSDIPSLWRHTAPDFVIALDLDLETLRLRRGPEWPAWLYDLQCHRLREAIAAADIMLDSARHDPATILRLVLARLTDGLTRSRAEAATGADNHGFTSAPAMAESGRPRGASHGSIGAP